MLALAVSVALLVAHGHAAGARFEGMGLSACNGLPPNLELTVVADGCMFGLAEKLACAAAAAAS